MKRYREKGPGPWWDKVNVLTAPIEHLEFWEEVEDDMPVVITGDMTAEEVDQAIINDLNALVTSSGAETIQVEHRSIVRVLAMLGDKGKPKEIKSQAAPKVAAARAAPDDDDDDDEPTPARRGRR